MSQVSELKKAGVNVEPLLQNPGLLMQVANVGPKTAQQIYKEYGKNISLKRLEQVYRQINDKKKIKRIKKSKSSKKPNAKQAAPKQVSKGPVKKENSKYPLKILRDKDIPLEDVLGVFKVVLGTTGQGKSNTVAVIIEEYVKYDMPVHIVDVEGEHLSFAREMNFEVLNKRTYDPETLKSYLKKVLKRRKNLLIDVSTFDDAEEMKFLKDYFTTLWSLQDNLKAPVSLVIEEIHTLIPQGEKTPVKSILRTIAKRGRKRKIEAIFVTQRSQEADKSIITQAETSFLHKVSHPTNLKIYRTLIPDKELYAQVSKMGVGEIIYVNRGSAVRGMVRERETEHGSHTLSVKDLRKPSKIWGWLGA